MYYFSFPSCSRRRQGKCGSSCTRRPWISWHSERLEFIIIAETSLRWIFIVCATGLVGPAPVSKSSKHTNPYCRTDLLVPLGLHIIHVCKITLAPFFLLRGVWLVHLSERLPLLVATSPEPRALPGSRKAQELQDELVMIFAPEWL